MAAHFLPREAFADEQSYIAHRQHIAALQRAERLTRNVQPRTYRWGKPGSRTWRVHWRIKRREYMKRWYWKDPERARAKNRRWYWKDPVRAQVFQRERAHRYYAEHKEEIYLRHKLYRREHLEEVRRRELERDRARRAARPGYISQADRSRLARQFEYQMIDMRSEGLTWEEIAALTGRPRGSCESTYYRAMKRLRQQQDNQQQSA